MKGKVAIVASALLVAVTGSALAGSDSTGVFRVGGVDIEGTLGTSGDYAYANTYVVDSGVVDYLSVDVSWKDRNNRSLGNAPKSAKRSGSVSSDLYASNGYYATGYHQATHKGETKHSSTKVYR
ncbi:hypothetical protein Elgi_13170 [Paenibacillus elgii]|uniref:hypothetical protein n=1 Tax=Paenibacillus elgii TaxID=189691 RepID=UPI002D7CAEAF|nr:hypothetical protein Elgi_13170 [Paenibacillus elgii]